MTEDKKNTAKKTTTKKAQKKHVALRALCTSKGNVKKGEEFTCTAKELEIFKTNKAV